MLIKSKDSRIGVDTCSMRKAGADAELDAAYHIDFHYGQSPNWVVIHDLRLEAGGRTAQIDHLLINRTLQAYVLESKSFRSGFSINEHAEFTRWWNGKPSGIESPLEQNRRHILVLAEAIAPILPTRLGVRLTPEYKSLVVLSSDTAFKRPRSLDTSEIIKIDNLRSRIEKDMESESFLAGAAGLLRAVSTETLIGIGSALAGLHAPALHPTTAPGTPLVEALPNLRSAHSCKHCSSQNLRIEYGRNYYFRCDDCARNFAIHLEPGTRLKKTGSIFNLVTPTGEVLFFTNPVTKTVPV